MSISRRNNRALNRVLRDSLRARPRSEPPPQEAKASRTPAYTLCADIPESYNDSYVRAIPKDPQNTFVYWELPKDQTDTSLFADKGTAHVGNDEAVRIGEQLNEKQRQRLTNACNNENSGNRQDDGHANHHHVNTDYRRVYWDDGSRYYFNADNQCHKVDDYRLTNWDNGNRYDFNGGNQRHFHNVDDYRQVNRDNGNRYDFDNNGQQHNHNADARHQVNGENRYRPNDDLDNVYQHLRRHLASIYQLNWNDGERYDDGHQLQQQRQDDVYRLIRNDLGDYAPRRRDDGDAFSEMLSALIERCNRYIADYRQSESSPLARAISSGLLRNVREEARP